MNGLLMLRAVSWNNVKVMQINPSAVTVDDYHLLLKPTVVIPLQAFRLGHGDVTDLGSSLQTWPALPGRHPAATPSTRAVTARWEGRDGSGAP